MNCDNSKIYKFMKIKVKCNPNDEIINRKYSQTDIKVLFMYHVIKIFETNREVEKFLNIFFYLLNLRISKNRSGF